MFPQNSPTKVWDSVKVSTVQSCMQCMGDTVGPPRAMCSAWPHWGALALGASMRGQGTESTCCLRCSIYISCPD